ncbi:TetR/AcrR family transcriptional regulator [Virgibacillus senegalensis]|uniref:TetR/AcrR family transcriptional regulator n=1 Tax=Virgibacillus senegalensis TaxID=1499679 RepID=UPI00069D539A|nr:TetR/AcrR family transcriptional regulator [Virgibacillus senegalensis]
MTANNQRPLGRPRANDRKQPTTDIILKEAIELFLAHGYQEVSVDDVAKAANVTKATVYYYFPSKAALFTETIVQLMSRIHGQIQEILQKNTPLRERLLEIAEAHLTATVDIDLDGFMRETKNTLSEEQTKSMQKAEERLYKAIEQAITEAINKGESNIHPTFAAHAYVALLRVGNYRDQHGNGIFPTTTETAEQIVDFFWDGLNLAK